MAFLVFLNLSTAASEPGPTVVLVLTIVSYCSKTHFLLAILGELKSSINT